MKLPTINTSTMRVHAWSSTAMSLRSQFLCRPARHFSNTTTSTTQHKSTHTPARAPVAHPKPDRICTTHHSWRTKKPRPTKPATVYAESATQRPHVTPAKAITTTTHITLTLCDAGSSPPCSHTQRDPQGFPPWPTPAPASAARQARSPWAGAPRVGCLPRRRGR